MGSRGIPVRGDSLKPAEMGGSGSTRRPALYDRVGRERLLLALILIVAAAVRLIGIGQPSFSSDELYELRIAHASLADIVTFSDGFPPLYSLLFHLMSPFGDLAGRVLSAVLGAAAVGVTWAWARRVAGNKVGLYAASLMALSPFALYFSGEGRAYALMALLTAASLWSLWVAMDDSSMLAWVRWGVVSALGMYTHYLFAVVIVGGFFAALIEVRGHVSKRMWIGAGALAVLAAPALALLPGDTAAQMSYATGAGIRPERAVYAVYELFVGVSLGPSFRDVLGFGLIEAIKAAWIWIAVLALPVSLLLVEGYRGLGKVTRRRLLTLSACGLLLELAVIHVSGYGFGALYILWLLFPLVVWLGAGLAHIRPRWRWATAGTLLVVAVLSVAARWLDPHHHSDDARGVAAYLESSGALNHMVLVSGHTRVRPILYYIDRPLALSLPDQWDPVIGRLDYNPDDGLPLTGTPDLSDGDAVLADAMQVVDTVTMAGEPYYLVYTHTFYSDRHGELLATLTARDGLTLVQEFAGMEVYRGVRAA